MIRLIHCLTLLIFVTLSLSLFAEQESAPFDRDYYSIGHVQVEKIAEVPLLLRASPNKGEAGTLGEVIMVADKLIALGQKIWPIVKAGKPVIDAQFNGLSVIPPGLAQDNFGFDRLFSWSAPKAVHYQVTYKNLYGITVAQFIYSINFQYAGATAQGGQYITGLKVIPQMIGVSWGFTFNASAQLNAITNRGSAQDPIAGATLEISYSLSSVIKEIRSQNTFHVTGRGEIINLNP
ncbi:MAG: hypothetical protein WCG27_03345 [Pseudomonadota bacterium]